MAKRKATLVRAKESYDLDEIEERKPRRRGGWPKGRPRGTSSQVLKEKKVVSPPAAKKPHYPVEERGADSFTELYGGGVFDSPDGKDVILVHADGPASAIRLSILNGQIHFERLDDDTALLEAPDGHHQDYCILVVQDTELSCSINLEPAIIQGSKDYLTNVSSSAALTEAVNNAYEGSGRTVIAVWPKNLYEHKRPELFAKPDEHSPVYRI